MRILSQLAPQPVIFYASQADPTQCIRQPQRAAYPRFIRKNCVLMLGNMDMVLNFPQGVRNRPRGGYMVALGGLEPPT